MTNDISYSGTRQGTFMPNLVLVSPSEIFYQLSAPLKGKIEIITAHAPKYRL
jgi:hypothetical protein